jgi:hypothetical protein
LSKKLSGLKKEEGSRNVYHLVQTTFDQPAELRHTMSAENIRLCEQNQVAESHAVVF